MMALPIEVSWRFLFRVLLGMTSMQIKFDMSGTYHEKASGSGCSIIINQV
jgi:hypothetical protein